jgi:Fe-S cluster biogenesis protein NfuA
MFTEVDVKQSLEKVRPFLQEDGGDVEIVRIIDDGILEIRMTGSCKGCPLSMMTLRAGIERALMLDIKELKRVEQVK